MDDLTEVYDELIMEHSINSHNKKKLDGANFTEKAHNPNCGDEIVLELRIKGDIIEDMAFTGRGCAVSQASASIMIDTLRGKTITEAKKLIKIFIGMMKKEETNEEELKVLGDAIILKKVLDIPARIKCVLLAWNTIDNILSE